MFDIINPDFFLFLEAILISGFIILFLILLFLAINFKWKKNTEDRIRMILISIWWLLALLVAIFNGELLRLSNKFIEPKMNKNFFVNTKEIKDWEYFYFDRRTQDNKNFYILNKESGLFKENESYLITYLKNRNRKCIKFYLNNKDESINFCDIDDDFIIIPKDNLKFLSPNLLSDNIFISIFLEDLLFYYRGNKDIKEYLRFHKELFDMSQDRGKNHSDLIHKFYSLFTKNIKYNKSIERASSKMDSIELGDYVKEFNLYESFNSYNTYVNKDWVCQGIVNLFYFTMRYWWVKEIKTIPWYYKIENEEWKTNKIGHIRLKIKDRYYDITFDLGKKNESDRDHFNKSSNEFYNDTKRIKKFTN